MDFKEFNSLYREDTISFLVALELFVDYGRDVLLAGSWRDLASAATLNLSDLFTEKKLNRIVEIAQSLAKLDIERLIAYLAQCGVCTGIDSSDEAGVCPVCGGRIEYDHEGPSERSYILCWHCLDCGATGEENHHLVFDAHYNLHEKSGDPIVRRYHK